MYKPMPERPTTRPISRTNIKMVGGGGGNFKIGVVMGSYGTDLRVDDIV